MTSCTQGARAAASSRMEAKAVPQLADRDAEVFIAQAVRELVASGIPFLVAGTYAVSAYTGISRSTKDLDIFCKAGDYARILAHFKAQGYAVEIEDDRWLGKVFKGRHFFDVIFASSNGTMPVSDQWFEKARRIELNGSHVSIIAPTELIWSKCFIQQRDRYDGADVAHVILRAHDQIDWHKLLGYLEVHWEVLLIHLLNFRWIYPTERDKVPLWLLDELLDRLAAQRELPLPQTKICRGRMYSHSDFEIDVKEWGFADVGGDGEARSE
ncbi:nucleotidyltransferase family protein [Rhizobium sullae]|uniref:nucleotidyltransferase family protein n=1 Tax=Rhizobium sullae TaxID=50338 RepID=UPI000B359609|nr:nucleotidyltransferase family protein [Rhizobium sullae]